MSFLYEPVQLPDYASVKTDEEARALLPPFLIAQATYEEYLRNGDTPRQALKKTLQLWRELWLYARP